MQLSKFSDYALRILMHLAVAPDGKMTTRQIADIHGAKYNHLAKVTQWLAHEGYVTSTRGRWGGVHLRRDASDIRIGQLIRELESRHSLVECLRSDGGACVLAAGCGLTKALLDAEEAFMRSLDTKTLADLTAGQTKAAVLLKRLNAA